MVLAHTRRRSPAHRNDHRRSAPLATHALATNNTEQARHVSEIAESTGASDDITLLDLIAINYTEGHDSQAQALVQRILINNDAEIEEDLPPRTFDVLHKLRRQWAKAS